MPGKLLRRSAKTSRKTIAAAKRQPKKTSPQPRQQSGIEQSYREVRAHVEGVREAQVLKQQASERGYNRAYNRFLLKGGPKPVNVAAWRKGKKVYAKPKAK